MENTNSRVNYFETETPFIHANSHESTDSIISDYENKIRQNIIVKIMSATKRGKMP